MLEVCDLASVSDFHAFNIDRMVLLLSSSFLLGTLVYHSQHGIFPRMFPRSTHPSQSPTYSHYPGAKHSNFHLPKCKAMY
jgi:hypothetical protein